MKYYKLEHSSIRLLAHEKGDCKGDACTLHKRTKHHMREFRQFWRSDRGIMERICTHGIGHPDPDDYRIINGDDPGIHGCDGCCFRFASEEEYESHLESRK